MHLKKDNGMDQFRKVHTVGSIPKIFSIISTPGGKSKKKSPNRMGSQIKFQQTPVIEEVCDDDSFPDQARKNDKLSMSSSDDSSVDADGEDEEMMY